MSYEDIVRNKIIVSESDWYFIFEVYVVGFLEEMYCIIGFLWVVKIVVVFEENIIEGLFVDSVCGYSLMSCFEFIMVFGKLEFGVFM